MTSKVRNKELPACNNLQGIIHRYCRLPLNRIHKTDNGDLNSAAHVDSCTREHKGQIAGAYLACSSVELFNEVNSVLSILPQSEIPEVNKFSSTALQTVKGQNMNRLYKRTEKVL